MHDHQLIVPFLTDDPAFARGVEVGLLYRRLCDGREDVIEDFFMADNDEQIIVMARRLGWRASMLPGRPPCWCRLLLERGDDP